MGTSPPRVGEREKKREKKKIHYYRDILLMNNVKHRESAEGLPPSMTTAPVAMDLGRSPSNPYTVVCSVYIARRNSGGEDAER